MNDEELTALAAKAYGNALAGFSPLTDDGDALRLAVKLGLKETLILEVGCGGADCEFNALQVHAFEGRHDSKDPYAATRRAITRAAAEIGRARA